MNDTSLMFALVDTEAGDTTSDKSSIAINWLDLVQSNSKAQWLSMDCKKSASIFNLKSKYRLELFIWLLKIGLKGRWNYWDRR